MLNDYERGLMNTFPIGVNGSEKYDVVSMVEVELLFDHPLRSLLYNDYVFLFSTMLDQDENSPIWTR